MKKFILIGTIALFLTGTLFLSSTLACDAKCQREIAKAIKSYTKYIERAEQKSCDVDSGKAVSVLSKNCSRDLKSLDKRYDKYPPEIKENPEIMALRERHLKLKEVLTGLADLDRIDKLVAPLERDIRGLEQKECIAGEFKLAEKCGYGLERADEKYANIPEADRSNSKVVELKKRFDALFKIYEDNTVLPENDKADRAAKVALKEALEKDFKEIGYRTFAILNTGKANGHCNGNDLVKLDAAMPKIKAFSEKCQGVYAGVLKGDYVDYAELALNADKYRNQLAVANAKDFLKGEIAGTAEDINEFKERKRVADFTHDRMMYGFDNYCKEVADKVTALYASVGQPAPSFDALRSLQSEYKAALEEALAANTWNDSGYYSLPKAFKKMVKEKADKMGLKVEDVKFPNEQWYVIKNDDGIPLKKSLKGYIVLKHPKESYSRIYKITIYRTFDGTGYQPASAINIPSYMGPTKI